MNKYNVFMQEFLQESTGFMGEVLAMLILEEHGGADAFNGTADEVTTKLEDAVRNWDNEAAMSFYREHGKKCISYMEDMISEEEYDRVEDMIASWSGLELKDATPEQVAEGLDDDTTPVGQAVALAITLATHHEILRYLKDHIEHFESVKMAKSA